MKGRIAKNPFFLLKKKNFILLHLHLKEMVGPWKRRKSKRKQEMVILNSPCPPNSRFHSFHSASTPTFFMFTHRRRNLPPSPIPSFSISSQLYNHQQQAPSPTTIPLRQRIDKSFLDVSEAHSDSELWAACCLRVRSFYDFPEQSFGIQVIWLNPLFDFNSINST